MKRLRAQRVKPIRVGRGARGVRVRAGQSVSPPAPLKLPPANFGPVPTASGAHGGPTSTRDPEAEQLQAVRVRRGGSARQSTTPPSWSLALASSFFRVEARQAVARGAGPGPRTGGLFLRRAQDVLGVHAEHDERRLLFGRNSY